MTAGIAIRRLCVSRRPSAMRPVANYLFRMREGPETICRFRAIALPKGEIP